MPRIEIHLSSSHNTLHIPMSSAGQTWSYTDEQQACIRICEDLVEQRMRNLDGSHDSLHVYRVRSLALKIADTVLGADRFVVEVAALLHDLYDKKYNETNVTDQRFFLSDLLCKSGIDLGVGNDIIEVAQNISYSSEVKAEANGFTLDLNPRLVPSWTCVHDADYLDAIGAIGVLRTSAFAGVRYTSSLTLLSGSS